MINQLSLFFEETKTTLKLNRKGHEALVGLHNFSLEINNNMTYGGVNHIDFQFNENENKLVKTNINVH